MTGSSGGAYRRPAAKWRGQGVRRDPLRRPVAERPTSLNRRPRSTAIRLGARVIQREITHDGSKHSRFQVPRYGLAPNTGCVHHPLDDRQRVVDGHIAIRTRRHAGSQALAGREFQALLQPRAVFAYGYPPFLAFQKSRQSATLKLPPACHLNQRPQGGGPGALFRDRLYVDHQGKPFALHQGTRDRVFVGKVLVQGADADARKLCDLVGGEPCVPGAFENASSRFDDGIAGCYRPALRRLFPGGKRLGRNGLCHAECE